VKDRYKLSYYAVAEIYKSIVCKMIFLSVMIHKNMVMCPTGPDTKNDYAGKGQQEFAHLTDQESERVILPVCQNHKKNIVMCPSGPRTKNDCWQVLAAVYLTD
jgi:hypothetical protein